MNGILYGVSVGPGEPELMTIKAVRIIEKCEVIAVPRTRNENTLALDIASQICDISKKEIVYIDYKMSREKAVRESFHRETAERLAVILSTGKNIAFLNIGDVSIYSTFSYIAELIAAQGFCTEYIPGVTSFCAAAAAVGKPLVCGKNPLIIAPASSKELESLLKSSGTTVIMKSSAASEKAMESLSGKDVFAVSECGLSGEKIYSCFEEIPRNCGYFTTIIVSGDADE